MEDTEAAIADEKAGTEYLLRRIAERDACSGIDTAKLYPGAMGEMVEALEMLLEDAEQDQHSHSAEPGPSILAARAALQRYRGGNHGHSTDAPHVNT